MNSKNLSKENNLPKENIETFARRYSKAAIEALVEIVNDKSIQASVRVSAIETLLERGWGKPPARKQEPPPNEGFSLKDVLIEIEKDEVEKKKSTT